MRALILRLRDRERNTSLTGLIAAQISISFADRIHLLTYDMRSAGEVAQICAASFALLGCMW